MNLRNTIGGTLLAIGALALPTLSHAAKNVDIEISTAPPPPVSLEVAPPEPRTGYIYERGHYAYNDGKYVWEEPRYIREREGHHWVPYELEKRGEHWHYRAGHWDDE